MQPCRCALFRDLDVDEFHADSPVRRFEALKKRGLPMWWLTLGRCADCGQHWLVAQEERLNDIYVLMRTTDEAAAAILARDDWPDTLSTYEELLHIGKVNGHAARYANPSELWPVAIDLVGQRPTITAHEFASLSNISPAEASSVLEHARTEIANHGYPYPWRTAG